jgi:uncharacterized protein YdhG (YjbR/CyaY superfamily)
MVKATPQSVDDYIAAQPLHAQRVLQRVRNTIHKALPQAEEVISYKIPAFKANGKIVIYFAGWTDHYSLYPVNERTLAAFEGDLDPYKAGKGTLRFALDEPVPVKLIERLVRFHASELDSKNTRSKKPIK